MWSIFSLPILVFPLSRSYIWIGYLACFIHFCYVGHQFLITFFYLFDYDSDEKIISEGASATIDHEYG
jgi:hypothetical protein